ncbi:MAG: response regulator [Candidatus Scalinduaceae bacterium]
MGSKKILLIEDDPDHAELIIDVLRTENVKKEIILLKDGLEALDYLQKIDIDGNDEIRSQIDLVILDLNLPRVSGMEVLKFLKKNSRYCSIPVVILSTSADHETIETAYKNGANSYITKPISYEGFVEKIKALSIYC